MTCCKEKQPCRNVPEINGEVQGHVHESACGNKPDDCDDVVGQLSKKNVENDSRKKKAEQEPERNIAIERAAHQQVVQVVTNETDGRETFVAHLCRVFETCAAEREYGEGDQKPFGRSPGFDKRILEAEIRSGLEEEPGHHEEYQAAPEEVQGGLTIP